MPAMETPDSSRVVPPENRKSRSCVRLPLTLLACFAATTQLIFPQLGSATSEDQRPSFEVISIHEHEPGYWPTFERMQFTQDGLVWQNALPQSIIVYAYNLRDPKLQRNLIPGAPKWIRTDWCDIRAKLSDADIEKLKGMDPAARQNFQRLLLQSLLAERFDLKSHLVPTDTRYFELTVAKKGLKNIRSAKPDEKENMVWVDLGYGQFTNFSIQPLILFSEMEEDALVVDKTGLAGKYDYEIKWARSPGTMARPGTTSIPQPPSEEEARPQIARALEEQLGLKLTPVRGILDQIVIESIQHPTSN